VQIASGLADAARRDTRCRGGQTLPRTTRPWCASP